VRSTVQEGEVPTYIGGASPIVCTEMVTIQKRKERTKEEEGISNTIDLTFLTVDISAASGAYLN